MITVRYFAWLRERVGHPSEAVETGAATVAGLVEELRRRDAAHALAFADLAAVRGWLDGPRDTPLLIDVKVVADQPSWWLEEAFRGH